MEAYGLMMVQFNQNIEGQVGFSQVKKGRGHSQQRDQNVQELSIVKQNDVFGKLLNNSVYDNEFSK